ncbi:MAG: choice-of-anchor J domain-containing protein, partial [Muribaculaceae bacterium]|nr:choice-of-anchor J domain-containing protein [Muribaculaceae bacterium]
YYVCLDNISLVAPTTPDTPGLVTDFLVTPDYNGATQGLVSFKAPVQSINGNDLTSLTKITVKRNDAVVHTFGECAPGAELSFTDRASEIGQYSYEIVAYNEYGAGTTFTAAARLGVNLMPAAKNAAITETSPGKVRLTWDAPTEDIAGFPISPDVAHYAILDKTGLSVLAEDLAATQFDIDVVAADGTQTFVFYYIMTQTAAGLNNEDYVYTPQIPVGPAYSYPFYESFAGGRLSNAWAITRGDSGTATWGVGPSSQQPVASPQDGDGGLAGFQPYAAGEEANLHSGKIAIPGDAVAPCLSFYYYAVAGATDELDAMISVDHGEFETLKTVVLNETGQTGWTRVIVPLDAYKGRTVEIGFNGRCVTHNYLILIDNISVADVLSNNLAVDGLYAPASMVAGTQGTVRATVHNRGIAAAEGAKAALVCDGERVDTQEIGLLQAGAKTDVVFAMVPSVFAEGATDCHVEILWDADMLKSDNKTEVLPVRIVAPTLPPVTDLSARVEGGNIVLEWGEPDLSAQIARTVREDFEECESFAVNRAGDWTFIDGDQAATYGIEDVEFPHNGEPMAYIVFDNTAAGLDTSFAMASGNKCLVSISNASGVTPNDDWAISPRLDGSAQTVSFDVRSYTDRYGYDSYEVLYSTTGTDRDSFVKLAENKTVPTTWTTYSYQLPAGAVYFAIRCTSADTFMFMVDNVEYISATAPSVPELKGFNVYRDHQPLVSCQAGHAYAEPYNDKAVYHVTAVYATGESVPSNEVSGNSSINLTDSADALTAVGKSGEIEVRHAAGVLVDIYAANGACVYSASDSDTHRVAVAPGVYLVRGAGLTIKVVVR